MCLDIDVVSVHRWATTLMRKHHDQGLTPQHFSLLMRDPKLAGILTHLVQHVRPPEEQRAIKLNLRHAAVIKELKGGGNEEEEGGGGKEDGGLGSERHLRLKAALQDANMAINAEVKEMHVINQRVEERRQSACEARRRSTTLSAARGRTEAATDQYQRWTCHLNQLQHYGRAGNVGSTRQGGAANVSVQRTLKATLLGLENYHLSAVGEHGSSAEDARRQKVLLWKNVGDSVGECGARALLGALLGQVKAATRDLQTLVQNVDLARDARELRVKCEKDGTFIDDSNPGGVVQAVREMLHLMYASHVDLYLHAHRENEHAASLTRALATLTNNISTAVKRKYSSDEAVCACMAELARENIALAGEKAALATILALLSKLQQRAAKATQAREAIRDKYTTICTFEKKVQEAQSTIRSLSAAVENGWPEIKGTLDQLRASVDASLSLVTTPTPTPPPQSLTIEGDFYTKLPLACLLTADCDGQGQKPKVKMSNTPVVWYLWQSTQQQYWESVRQIKHGMTSWEGLYQAVCQRLAHSNSLHTQLERLSFLRAATAAAPQLEAGKATTVITSHDMKKVKEDIAKHDKKQEKEVRQLLQAYREELSRCDELLPAVTTLLQDWWEQPAKDIPVK